MNRMSTKKIVLNGLMIALVYLTTIFTRIPGPIPQGYINFGDAVIIVAAVLLGKKSGLLAGALGSLIADLSVGAYLFAPITLVVKGLEGYIIGAIAEGDREGAHGEFLKLTAMVAGTAVMVLGYFIAEWYILGFFDETFGYAAAIVELPMNLVQAGVSVAVGYVLSTALIKLNVKRYILN